MAWLVDFLEILGGDSYFHILIAFSFVLCCNVLSWRAREKQRNSVIKDEYYSPARAAEELKNKGAPDPRAIEKLLPNITAEDAGGQTSKYSWIQTRDEIEILFPISEDIPKNFISVEITSKTLSVGVKMPKTELEEVLVDGKLFAEVETAECAWSVTKDSKGQRNIEVFLQKVKETSGKGHWKCICLGEPEIDVSKFGPIVDYIDERDDDQHNGFSDLIGQGAPPQTINV